MNNEDKNKKLEELERRQREIADEIEQLRQEPDEPIPWEPNGGKYQVINVPYFDQRFSLDEINPDIGLGDRIRLGGSQYPTREAAESVAKRDYFFRRLCALACELNPSGQVGGSYCVVKRYPYSKWDWDHTPSYDSVNNLFETESAAKKASDILNRDGWRLD